MIDIETIKTIATEDWDINWSSKTILELIHRLEAAESKQILGASARHFKQMEAAESQQVAQGLVIQQLRDALIFWDDCDKALAIPTSTEHLEAWYKEMVGEPVAYLKDDRNDVVIGKWVSNQPEFIQNHWKAQTPLHAIKPFPFKGK